MPKSLIFVALPIALILLVGCQQKNCAYTTPKPSLSEVIVERMTSYKLTLGSKEHSVNRANDTEELVATGLNQGAIEILSEFNKFLQTKPAPAAMVNWVSNKRQAVSQQLSSFDASLENFSSSSGIDLLVNSQSLGPEEKLIFARALGGFEELDGIDADIDEFMVTGGKHVGQQPLGALQDLNVSTPRGNYVRVCT